MIQAQTKFWLVWNKGGRAPMVQHPSASKARKEAERLASVHPGQTFVVLASVGEARSISTQWTSHDSDEPFFTYAVTGNTAF